MNSVSSGPARREQLDELAADPVLTLEHLPGKREERMMFDLNAAGLPDEVIRRFWDRWGVSSCTITAAGLAEVGTLACARIGILPTKGWRRRAPRAASPCALASSSTRGQGSCARTEPDCPGVHAIGPVSRSAFGEITVIPDIRVQASWLAATLLDPEQ